MRAFFFSCTLFVLGSCSNIEVKEIVEGDTIERYTIDKKTGQKIGAYQRLVNDILVESASYQNDTLDGLRILYTRSGAKEIEEHYEKGVYHGPYNTFYENGTQKIEGQYLNGTMEGAWKKFYESGQLMESVAMHENNENGPFVDYWESGNLKAEGNYLDGDNEDGELKLYDEGGNLMKIMQCERGICRTTWKPEAEPSL